MFKKLLFVSATVTSTILISTNLNVINDKFQSAFSLSHDPLSIVKKWDPDWDKVSFTTNQSKKESKATRHLILIRHGQYVYNDEDSRCKLTLLGREQAMATGNRLKQLNIDYDELIHSDMTRARETAAIIKGRLESLPGVVAVKEDRDLAEGCPWINEPPLPHWTVSTEVIKEDQTRIERAYRRYFHRAEAGQDNDSYTVLVCHANVIRYMLCRALQFPPEGWIRLSLDHGSISWVSIRPSGAVVVRAIGNSGFMNPDIITVS